ncbi:hypothetical protein DN585_03535 [Intrasporangium calvum]|nr:hypothetical protein DN585_03535 [Intrasporangium calvum]
MFEPLPEYAQNDTFELFMFYAVPLMVGAYGVGLAFIALRSGVFVDEGELIVRPFAGIRSRRMAVETIEATTVKRENGPVVEWVSPAVVATGGETIVLGLAHYNTSRGRRRAVAQAEDISRRLERPLRRSDGESWPADR